MKKILFLLLAFLIFFPFALLYSQPVIDGDMSDAHYTTLATFTNGNNGAGAGNYLASIKYYAEGTNLFIGIPGELITDYNVLIFFDFSGYNGRGSNNLGAGMTNIFNSIGGTIMDFDVDFALSFYEDNVNSFFKLDACRYKDVGAATSAVIGSTPDQLGTSVTSNLGGTFGGAGNIIFAYHNNYAGNNAKGIEMKIPIAAFDGITNSQALRIFAIITTSLGSFTNECIPGNPGANPGVNPDFSIIAGQTFNTSYCPLLEGITFDCRLDAGPSSGPWVGDLHSGENPKTPFTHHYQNPNCLVNTCGSPFYDCGYYAYKYLTWNPDGTTYNNTNCCSPYNNMGSGQTSYANAVVENTDVLNGITNVTVTFETFTLTNLNRRNWGAAGAGPNGLMGDTRTYTGGVGYVKVDGVTKLKVTNNFIELDVDYPTPYGPGDNVVGTGQGTIDVANSDANWVAAFNNGNGQIQYDFYSFSPTIQNCYGAFTFTLILRSAEVQQNVAAAVVPGNQLVALDDAKVKFNISAHTVVNDNKQIHARQILKQPTGTLPGGIQSVADRYWRLGTTLEAITTQLIFDLNGINGINNTNNLRILKRTNGSASWTELADYTLPGQGGLTTSQIRANNITSFSEFVVASTTDLLPVELMNLNAISEKDVVILKWNTITEIQNFGWEVLRRKITNNDISSCDWEKIGFVKGSGNNNSPKEYVFIDKNAISGIFEYQLKQIDLDGSVAYSDIIKITCGNKPSEYSIKNFPNPFNPITNIRFEVPKTSHINISIYNALGEKIITLKNELMTEGKYQIEFDGSQYSSGVYICELKSGDVRITNRILLVK